MQLLEAVPDVSRFMPQMSGAAAKIETVSPGGVPHQFVLFRNYPRFDEQRGGSLIFTFEGMDERYYTGLQVAKDPGVWVVWLGCTLMVIGIGMAFFLSHRRVWVRIAHGKITMAGTASKNPAGFQINFDHMVDKLKNS
jgi:cytochrome c biogenesis protein